MKPGKPVFFGRGRRQARWFSVCRAIRSAALVCFELFVRPVLRRLAGHAEPGPFYATAILAENFTYRTDRPTYYPAWIEKPRCGISNGGGDGSRCSLARLTRPARTDPCECVRRCPRGRARVSGRTEDDRVARRIASIIHCQERGQNHMQETGMTTAVATLPESHARSQSTAPSVVLPWPRLLPALFSGLLLFASFFPLACGWLAWVALVPLLCLVRSDATKKRVFFCAWLGGLAFFIPALQWMRVADIRMYLTWIGLALCCSLFLPVGVLLVRAPRRTHTSTADIHAADCLGCPGIPSFACCDRLRLVSAGSIAARFPADHSDRRFRQRLRRDHPCRRCEWTGL